MSLSIISISLLLILLIYTVFFFKKNLVFYLAMMLFVLSILLFIFPEFSTHIANLLKVGRGLDLVLILYTLFSFFVIIIIARYLFLMHVSITQLARYVAIENRKKLDKL
jgi:hypothetical protein